MEDKKQKYAYWMRPSLVAEMTEMLESANATSKSDFVCQAVEFYIGYLRQQKNIDYLSPILAGVIRDEVESVEKNVCEMLFRLAVEQAKLCHAVAANSHYSEETMQRLHKQCAHEVIISRRGKHRIALWKAPFCFTESTRAQRGKHEN